jgi:hypothetical protein
MRELVDPFWMKVKAALFLVLGFGAGTLLLLQCPSWRVAACLAISVWSFCRFYYFAFYVIEHYVDPGWRFSGLWSFARYMWTQRAKKQP